MDYQLLALTIGPAISIAIYVYWRGKLMREPLHKLLKAFFLGCVSVVPAIAFELLFRKIGVKASPDFTRTVIYAFIGVGLSEEFSKFFFLRKYFYRDKVFDEPYDGITYSVMISMGFATLENILYVYVYSKGDPHNIALARAFTAVPAHATFAIAMGYYTGVARFKSKFPVLHLTAALLVAMIMHGSYDFFILQRSYPKLAGGAMVSLVVSVIYSLRAIKLHVAHTPFQHR
ncbi:MAG: PrsW family intramembrane metalloprotease [Bacteroidia bacterium]|nr:PrsW family intramembrane metalloprotease [Bacteroidia bacterium]